jgi:hypothetical protein
MPPTGPHVVMFNKLSPVATSHFWKFNKNFQKCEVATGLIIARVQIMKLLIL